MLATTENHQDSYMNAGGKGIVSLATLKGVLHPLLRMGGRNSVH